MLVASPAFAQRQPRDPSVLLGGGPSVKRPPVETDPWLPTGAQRGAFEPRPTSKEPAACDFTVPVCVHRGDADPQLSGRALQALAKAYRRLVWVMGLPAPPPDRGAGGGDGLDLYLSVGPNHALRTEPEPAELTLFDRSPSYCTLTSPAGPWLDRDATLCVGEAIARGLDAAATPHVRRAYATHLWNIVGSPTSADLEAVDEVQAHPELALVTREFGPNSEGSALFFEALDFAYAKGFPGTLATALLSQSAGKTPPGAWLWDNEPDVMDVLRHTFDDKPGRVAEALGDLSVRRAFVGDRDDGAHLPTLGFAGAFGRVRFDWHLKFSSLPRRVASVRPIEPTGSIYVWLEMDRVPDGATLGFQAVWEPPVSFQWVLVRIGNDGREQSRLMVPFKEKATEAEQSLVKLEGTAGILVVGTNMGGVDLAHPFDPDVAPHEPHACTVYLAKL